MKIGRMIGPAIATHAALVSGIHGVGADNIISDAEALASDAAQLTAAIVAIGVHSDFDTNVHGVGESPVCSETEADDKIAAAASILNVKGFQFNPAIGTMTDPANINDGSTGTSATSDVIGQYGEVLFIVPAHITQFRQYGNASNNGDGAWKIEYQDLAGNWQDWVTGIATRTTGDWSNWDSTGGDVIARGIRLIATAIDTYGMSVLNELEVKY